MDAGIGTVADSAPVAVAHCDRATPKRVRRRTLTKIDRRGRLGRRIDELVSLFPTALGDSDVSPLRLERVREAAQLKALAERVRGEFMREGTGELADIVSLERRAEQAVRALGIVDGRKAPTSPLVAHFAKPLEAAK